MSRRAVFAVVAAVATLIAALPSLAADDGGGRSVFAYGAGSRALGLGGAYGAVADDASAVLWNPGGLGLVRRPGLEVTQTGYYGLDVSEQYASLVYPHWRYGTTSITFRRVGVSAIERRDERNALISDDLSSSETELLLGYGRRLARAWSVGGAVKLRRQSLADFSDSGLGLDLGIMFHPLELFATPRAGSSALAVGLSVRNVVRPRLRLLEERVADPTGIRLGVAWTRPVFGSQSVLAAFDIEKTADMDTRIHGGVEYAPHPLLRLRVGASDGSFTAGTRATWNGVAVDYTFEQNSIEDVHRVGATFTFGRTVAETRQLALDARENELRARLDASFAERQRTRVRELLAEADAARDSGRYEDALVTLAAVAALDPDNAEARSRRADCLYELARAAEARGDYAAAILGYSEVLEVDPDDGRARAGYDRSRAESDRLAERGQERRRQFSAAMDAFIERRLVEARVSFASLLESAPDDEEVAAMLERTDRAIASDVTDLIDQSARLMEWKQFDEAAAALARAHTLSPRSPEVVAAQARLTRARNSERAREQAAKRPEAGGDDTTATAAKVVTPEERREADRLYKRALEAVAERRSDDAIRYLELVWTIDPGYQRVQDHLKREYLTRGMEYFADGNLDKAIDLWERVLRVDPDDERARGYLSRAREQATRTREILGGAR